MVSSIKVLIADDSASAIRVITQILSHDREFNVVDIVNNGKAAIKSVKDNKPDVILMDLNMPIMNGLEATEKIMAENPTPILILTSRQSVSGNFSPYQAIKIGAVDVMEKPDLELA